MSIRDFYKKFEVHYEDCLEAYFEETRGNHNVSNFGQSMPLSVYMEGHGAGFGMQDHEDTSRPEGSTEKFDADYSDMSYERDPRHQGVTQVLRGFHEDVVPESNIYVQEILDTIGPDSDEGGGPFDLECGFTLSDYIMFRGELRGRPFTRYAPTGPNGEMTKIREPNIIEFEYSPWQAIEAAREIFHSAMERFDNTRETISKRFSTLVRIAEERSLGEGMPRNYLTWCKNYLFSNDEPEGFEYHFEPITDSRDDVVDMKQTRQQVDDIGYHEGEQERLKLESRNWDCFRKVGEKWEKELCTEEFSYRKRAKEERELRTQGILDWIKRVPVQNVVEAFSKRGVFHKTLRDSRTICLPDPERSYRTTFKTSMEVWLTKEQANRCIQAAQEKTGIQNE